MSVLWDELAPYRDLDGLVANRWLDPGVRNASGNGVAYTACAGIGVFLRGEMTEAVRQEIQAALLKCEVRPGVFARGPVNPDQEGPDDYLWLVAYSAITGEREIARRVLGHGTQNPFKLGPLSLFFNYCNVCSENVLHSESWLGRQGQLVAHFRFAAGEPMEWPSWWQRLWWGVNLLFASRAKREDQDAWMHSWALSYTSITNEQKGLKLGWFCALSRWWWFRSFQRAYPEGLQGPLSTWLTDSVRPHLSGEHHPLVALWPRTT